MRVIYAGTPEFAVPALQALLQSRHEVIAVYTQPDRPAGRGKQLRASPVKQAALAADVPVYQPASLKKPEAQIQLAELDADVMVVAAYGLILPPAVLAAPRYGCLNIHASLLPRWRGAAPIQRAILEGDRGTGVTIMQMAEGLDTGDMLLKYPVMIMPEDTAATIHDKLAELGATGILTALEQIESGTLKPEPQDDSQANYAAKLSKEEAVIDWCQDAEKIVRKIQAFNPWPVAQSLLDNQVVRIWEAGLDSGFQAGEPGVVLREDRQQGVLVQADHGAVWLKTLQLPGGKPLKAQDFLNGRSLLGKRFQTS